MIFLKKNKIYLVVFLYFILKMLSVANYKMVWWDASVYIGMGKYIYSFGSAGLWESSRPLVWSLMLGFLWKAGFGILAARLTEIIFGCFVVFMTYLIGRELFDEKTALLSSFFLAISPTFFFFNGIMLTEIISTFFSLLAVYLLLKNKHFLSGTFFGIAFMTRFLQLLAFTAVILALIYDKKFKSKKIFLGFAIVVLPYLIISQILYNNAFFPFIQQAFLAANSGWLNHHPISYYFIGLFKDNFLYLFFIAGIILAFNKQKNRLIIFPLIILFLFFNLIKQKEMRFLIMLLPYMYLLASHALVYFIERIKLKNFAAILVFVLLVLSTIKISFNLASESGKINKYEALQAKLNEADGNIWVSSPIIAVESDKKISRLIYYPVFWQDFDEMLLGSRKADFIFLDVCDLGCRPYDNECEENKKEMVSFFKQNFNQIYSKQGECPQYAFKR